LEKYNELELVERPSNPKVYAIPVEPIRVAAPVAELMEYRLKLAKLLSSANKPAVVDPKPK
jgi:hypothetical protein